MGLPMKGIPDFVNLGLKSLLWGCLGGPKEFDQKNLGTINGHRTRRTLQSCEAYYTVDTN